MALDLFRYHDLSKRLTAFSTDGGRYLRGDREDLQIADAEPLLAPGERERVRFAGALRIVGPRSTSQHPESSLGLVLEGGGALVVTNERLIVLAAQGGSQLGRIGAREVHTFVLPFDLVDSIGMPARRALTDRIAGSRTIAIFSAMVFTQLALTPVREAEFDGRRRPVGDDGVMRLLVEAVVDHRLTVSPADDHARLQRLRDGRYALDDGELLAEITADGRDGDLPPHLVGRLAQDERPGRRAARDLLLLHED